MLIGDLLLEKEANKCFIYINGLKVDVEQTNLLQLLNKNIDKEFSTEIKGLLDKIPDKNSIQTFKLGTKLDLQINSVDEKNKSVYGIKAGVTNRKGAYHVLRSLLKIEGNYDLNSQYVSFEDAGLAFYFNSANDIVEEIILAKPFEGATSQGLRIGHSMEKAYELCGEPRIRSIVTAFWNNFSVYIKNEIITSIRIY
jgi:hypothetical protein